MKRENSASVFYGHALPQEALRCLEQNGFLPPDGPPPAPPAGPVIQPLSPLAQQIWKGLTRIPLNDSQTALVAIYARAKRAGEPPLSVHEAGQRLAAEIDIDPARAEDFVKGALRSFGRRLSKTVDTPTLRFGRDRLGDGTAEAIPSLAMFDILTGPSGETCHRLTDDGAAAVAAVLGIAPGGQIASWTMNGAGEWDPDQVVAMGMTSKSAALMVRVQRSLGLSMDETIQRMTAQAGAG